jgi:ATP-dependent exoDNAse (exonuclease V) beta subunit
MVGDFQQCIYGGSPELENYLAVHRAIIAGGGTQAKFAVTFRLDTSPIDLVNASFPTLLSDSDGQVAFVPLKPRPSVLGGQVVRIEVPGEAKLAEAREAAKSRHTAGWLAQWIHETGLEQLRAERWSEVAILCPRKGWFAPLRSALRAKGFEVQAQSEREIRGDSPAYAWFTALVHVLAEPEDTFETVGVLREVFGVSDETLARHVEEGGNFLSGARAFPEVAELEEVRKVTARAPLFRAVEEIVKRTRLRDRLLSLPASEYGELDAELEELMVLAAAAEADGHTLEDFDRQLRTSFAASRESRATQPNAIQLITSHKAKGSEWQAVIVPSMGREIGTPPRKYPMVFSAPGSGEV